MIIRSKYDPSWVFFPLLSAICIFSLTGKGESKELMPLLVCCGPFVPIFFILFVSTSRKLVMDNAGCTIKSFFWKKRFSWDELYIWEENYKNFKSQRVTRWKNCVCFSKKELKYPRKFRPYDRMCISPFGAFFFVNFDPGESSRESLYIESYIWTVDETVFREKMAEWGVDISKTIPWL